MKIAIDIGNTDVVLGVHTGTKWTFNWRTPSNKEWSSIDYENWLRLQLLETGYSSNAFEAAILSSVVPSLTESLADAVKIVFATSPLILKPAIIRDLKLGSTINPDQIGSDLVANAVGAYDRFNTSAIIVDFGTALTFTSINDQGEIFGVAISPGVRTAMKSLSLSTAKLPEIPLEIPRRFFGSNTIEAMQAGIMQGYVGLVRHMVTETKKQHTKPPKVIATGGLSFAFKPLHDVFDEIDRDLTLNGLLVVFEKIHSSLGGQS